MISIFSLLILQVHEKFTLLEFIIIEGAFLQTDKYLNLQKSQIAHLIQL